MRDRKFAARGDKKRRKTPRGRTSSNSQRWVRWRSGCRRGWGVKWGRWQGCHGSVPDGQAVSSHGVRGDVGLSGSLAGRDTRPCDWGGARVSERGQD